MTERKLKWYAAGLTVLFLLLFLGSVFWSYDPFSIDPESIWLPIGKNHFLGTDSLGRDVMARLLYGGRSSVLLAFLVEVIAFPVGAALGYLGAGLQGNVIRIVDWIMDVWFAFPTIIMALLLAGMLGPGWMNVLCVIVITEIPMYYIYTKREVNRIKNELFVQVLREMGVSRRRIFIHHISIHLLPFLIPKIVFNFATTIIFESTLSFIGIGIQAPMPSWGNMISDGLPFMRVHPEMLFATSVFFAVTTLLLFGFAEALGEKLGGKK